MIIPWLISIEGSIPSISFLELPQFALWNFPNLSQILERTSPMGRPITRVKFHAKTFKFLNLRKALQIPRCLSILSQIHPNPNLRKKYTKSPMNTPLISHCIHFKHNGSWTLRLRSSVAPGCFGFPLAPGQKALALRPFHGNFRPLFGMLKPFQTSWNLLIPIETSWNLFFIPIETYWNWLKPIET